MTDQEDSGRIVSMKSEPEGPYSIHESNALSHFCLEITASSPKSTLTFPADLRPGNITMNNSHYTAVSAKYGVLHPLLIPNNPAIDVLSIDYNRVGILLEYGDFYFTVIHAPSAHNNMSIHCGWLEKRVVNTQMVSE
jgi:hypothetical protein